MGRPAVSGWPGRPEHPNTVRNTAAPSWRRPGAGDDRGTAIGNGRSRRMGAGAEGGYLVDPASSHMLVSKIKPCMSKYELLIL